MISLANPTRFLSLVERLVPWLTGATLILLAAGLYLAFFVAPPDYQQGETVRIMFVHVPAAWLAMFSYALIALSALGTLIWRHPLADVAAKAAAPIGATFTFIALVTGSLWGKPMWGTWWVWDARLTSVLILFFLYLGHMALATAFDDSTRGARAAAILALVGFVNVPIIKFSVDWWATLHQPASISRLDAPAIDPAMLAPLLLMAAGFMAYFVTVLLLRVRSEFLAAKLRSAALSRAAG
ncbi:MAG: heme ABC transporter permease [Methyloceanibacter sp.]